MAKDPKEFKKMIDLGKNEFMPQELEKINRKINATLDTRDEIDNMYESIMLGEKRPGLFNGYRSPDLEKVNNMVLYFAEKVKPFKTKMNKLLFYADFFHFKKTAFSITGLTYQAIQKGPVPKHYDWIFDNGMEKRLIKIKLHDYGNYMGEQFLPTGEVVFDKDLFQPSELKAMEVVANSFKKATVNDIVNKSHEEKAWNENVDEFKTINYNYGFELKYPV
jgi:uncharacterized phage-associated protein